MIRFSFLMQQYLKMRPMVVDRDGLCLKGDERVDCQIMGADSLLFYIFILAACSMLVHTERNRGVSS